MIHTSLSWMKDEELLRQHRSSWDPLTGTEVELELAARLTERIDAAHESKSYIQVAETYGIDAETLGELARLAGYNARSTIDLLDVLTRVGLRNANDLLEILERASSCDEWNLTSATDEYQPLETKIKNAA